MTRSRRSVLTAYGLGSCVGIAVWDPVACVAGLLHFMLPDSSLDLERGRDNPYLYADTGIPALIAMCVRQGASESQLVLRAAGGAQVLNEANVYEIGRRNRTSLQQVLTRSGLRLHSQHLGGAVSRTMRIDSQSGRCWVEEGGNVYELAAKGGQR